MNPYQFAPQHKHILVIEDDREIASLLATELGYEGYQVSLCHDGAQGLNQAQSIQPDLIILDRMLPGLDGLSLCRRLRQKQNYVPIIMLTALQDTPQKVEGLQEGANDYLTKPFDLEELLVRVQVQLRQALTQPRLHYADLVMNLESHEASRGAEPLSLTLREYELLHFFLAHPEVALNRQRILTEIWGWDYDGQDNILEVYIGYLRRKLEAGGQPRLIHTVRGVGYILKLET